MARLLVPGVVLTLGVVSALAANADPGPTQVQVPISFADTASSVVVEPGDHLWKISASHLSSRLGREAADAEIWRFWRSVIEANSDRLLSGDPDLIYPGEVIELPPG